MVKKLAWAAGTVVILIIAYNLISQIFATLKSGERVDQASEKLHQLEIINKDLKKKLEQVQSADFIEQEARDKLGLVKEGETLVIIPEEKIDLILSASKPAEEPRLPNWLGWWKVFF